MVNMFVLTQIDQPFLFTCEFKPPQSCNFSSLTCHACFNLIVLSKPIRESTTHEVIAKVSREPGVGVSVLVVVSEIRLALDEIRVAWRAGKKQNRLLSGEAKAQYSLKESFTWNKRLHTQLVTYHLCSRMQRRYREESPQKHPICDRDTRILLAVKLRHIAIPDRIMAVVFK